MKKIGTLSILGASLLVASCSGGKGDAAPSNSSGASFGEAMTAQFIDAPVKGLKLKTANGGESQTGDNGKFSCKRGELVSFSLGGLDLGYAACGDKIFVQDLVSNTNNYSWDQAAAIIQTFSINKTGYLDLSALDHTQLNLTGVSYDVTPANLNLGAALTSALTSGAYHNVEVADKPFAPVSVANAKTAANNYIASNISLSSELASVVEQLKVGGASSIELDGQLISETLIPGLETETCWKNIKAKSEVTLLGGVYSFNINSAVSFDNAADLEQDQTCSVGQANADKCETASRLPSPKIITSENIDMIFSSNYTEQGMNVTEQNVLSLKSSLGTNKVNFSGIYENKVTVTSDGALKGKSLICKYKIGGTKAVQTTVSSGSSKYSGALLCRDGSGDPITASVRAEVVVSGNFPGATAAVKVFESNNLVWSRSITSFQQDQAQIYYADGIVNTEIGPMASGGDFILTKYFSHSMMGNKLTLSMGSTAAHCDSYDGLQQE